MSPGELRRIGLALAAALVAAAVIGCGGGDEDDAPSSAPVAQATVPDQPSDASDAASEDQQPPANDDGDDDSTEDSDAGAGHGAGESDGPEQDPDVDAASSDDGDAGSATPAAEEGSDAEAAIEAAVREYHEAIGRTDGPAACELLAPEARDDLEGLLAQAPEGQPTDCGALLSTLFANYPPRARENVDRLEVTKVRVKGERAYAYFRVPGLPPSVMPLTLDRGSWMVAAIAGSYR